MRKLDEKLMMELHEYSKKFSYVPSYEIKKKKKKKK